MDFVVIDVETANSDFASICQVGIAAFRDGKLHELWDSLVDPEDYFDEMNVAVHGIDEQTVRGAAKWPAVHEQLAPRLKNSVVASHTVFDRAALIRACSKYGIQSYENTWLDTARVVRRAWPEFSKAGYGLANVAQRFGIEFQHHDAKEDARAAGEILLRAVSETGLSIEQWLRRVERPINPVERDGNPVERDGNVDGPLYGEKLVFTGALSMPRGEAADAAAKAGCEVDANVTKQTTILVVGDQDIRRLSGHEKSSKRRKAEDLMRKGQGIRIIGESDFQRLIGIRA